MRYWLFSGPQEHWVKAVSCNTWGVEPETQPMKQCWKKIKPGDLVIFYARKPVKGVIGFGILKKTTTSTVRIWNTERAEQHDYECRAPFEVIYHVLDGTKKPVDISDIRPQWTAGMNDLNNQKARQIFARIKTEWGVGEPFLMKRKTVMIRAHPLYAKFSSALLLIIGLSIGFLFDRYANEFFAYFMIP